MHYTRLYPDERGESHFEIVEVPLSDSGMIGSLSEKFPVKTLQFRENPPGYDWDLHNTPVRQFIIMLEGAVEITTSLGETRVFIPGDILLAEDTTGKGHKARSVENSARKSIFIQL